MTELESGSLYTGAGGFDLGFEWAGIKTAWQVEIDEACQVILEERFPHAERFRDIRQCGRHNLRWVPIIVGGFPCQDVSKAGNRAGIREGTRSGLWSEMLRILRELRPWVAVVENVPGLLIPDKGEPAPIARVLGDLAESGFDAEWDCLPAYTFGAPQPRDRTFIVAYPNGQRPLHGEAGGLTAEAGVQAFSDVRTGCDARVLRGPAEDQWEVRDRERFREPAVHRVCDGLPSGLDKARIKQLGNAVVPQVAQFIAERIRERLTEAIYA